MTSRELICNTLARRPTTRIPLTDLCFWPETIKRWEQEGLPKGADVYDYFGLDRIFIYYTDDSPKLSEKVISEDADSLVVSDQYGRVVKKWKHSMATPVNLSFAISDIAEAADYMDRYDFVAKDIADEAQASQYDQCVSRKDFTAVSPMDPAWFVIEYLLGFENGLMAFMESPDEISSVMRRLMDHSLAHLDWLIKDRGLQFDALWFFSDLCYRNGMLLSPRIYRELVLPIHLAYKRFCEEHGMFLMLHCDGDVRELMPLIVEAGFDAIQPLEARAGNDIRELKGLYGDRITMFGNINADVVANGTRDEIKAEVTSKVNAAKQSGGYVYHIDHSVPPTVSFENYSFLVETLKEVMFI